MRRLLAGLLVLGVAACGSMNKNGNAPSSPPPPASPTAEPTSPQAFIVFFVGHSVELTSDARKIVRMAARDAKTAGTAMVQVSGPSTQVAPNYDPGLASPRIKLVERELIADGVRADKIVRTSIPTDKVIVDATGAQRVEIRVLK